MTPPLSTRRMQPHGECHSCTRTTPSGQGANGKSIGGWDTPQKPGQSQGACFLPHPKKSNGRAQKAVGLRRPVTRPRGRRLLTPEHSSCTCHSADSGSSTPKALRHSSGRCALQGGQLGPFPFQAGWMPTKTGLGKNIINHLQTSITASTLTFSVNGRPNNQRN